MKVLIADKFEKVGIDGLKELGCTVVSEPDVKADALAELIRREDPNILIVRGKKVNADRIRQRPGWDAVTAVRQSRIHEIKSTYILQPGPASLTDGVQQLHAILAAGTAASAPPE